MQFRASKEPTHLSALLHLFFVHLYTNITSSFTFSILLRPFYLASIPLGAKLRHDMFRESKLPKRHQIGVQHTEEFLPFG